MASSPSAHSGPCTSASTRTRACRPAYPCSLTHSCARHVCKLAWCCLESHGDATCITLLALFTLFAALCRSGESVSMKEYRFAAPAPPNLMDVLRSEILLLRKHKHPNIVRYLGTGACPAHCRSLASQLAVHSCAPWSSPMPAWHSCRDNKAAASNATPVLQNFAVARPLDVRAVA